jgi:TetR/AcrR family transcriptional repressor of nem operon
VPDWGIMRYDNEHKTRTRARILSRAAERFKENGIAATGIAPLMADAGLTNGAFYTHFSSKEDLVGAVVADQMQREADRFAGGEESDVRAQIRAYLSDGHRDDRAGGCITAALAEDLARTPEGVRRLYTDGLLRSLEGLASRFPGVSAEVAKINAFGVFSILVGTLQTARTVSDAALSEAILEEGYRNAIRALRLDGS